jgi:hypothetical protein
MAVAVPRCDRCACLRDHSCGELPHLFMSRTIKIIIVVNFSRFQIFKFESYVPICAFAFMQNMNFVACEYSILGKYFETVLWIPNCKIRRAIYLFVKGKATPLQA